MPETSLTTTRRTGDRFTDKAGVVWKWTRKGWRKLTQNKWKPRK